MRISCATIDGYIRILCVCYDKRQDWKFKKAREIFVMMKELKYNNDMIIIL